MLVGTWTGEFDRDQAQAALSGRRPFDEVTMLDEEDAHGVPADETAADAGLADPEVRVPAPR